MTQQHRIRPPSSPPDRSRRYDEDFFLWTQEQATALRRIPAAALGDAIDIEHVAEEIEDLGERDLREVASLIRRICEHLVKLSAWPASPSALHWRSEIRAFQRAALDAFTPGMRQRIDVAEQWRRARRAAEEDLREVGVMVAAPSKSPLELNDLLQEPFDIDAALRAVDGRKSCSD